MSYAETGCVWYLRMPYSLGSATFWNFTDLKSTSNEIPILFVFLLLVLIDD